jgi:DNA repair protein RadD
MRVDEAMRLWTDNRMRRRVIVDQIAAIAENPDASVLYFGPSVEDAHAVALLLRLKGIQAQGVDGGTRREVRRMLIQRFKGRELQVLCNCELLTTGFDSPKVTHVVVGRPTTSQVLYEQMVGRGLRGPKFGGTKECEILDIIDGFPGVKPTLGYEAFREHWQVARLRLEGSPLATNAFRVSGDPRT